jgi:hypothetical protein
MNTGESEDEITVKLLAAAATDEILVAAAKLGDRPAFAELWARHSKRSLQIAYRITKNREDAEDVLQEAWTKAYVHLKSFDGKARFSTWLTRIAINGGVAEICGSRNRPNPHFISTKCEDALDYVKFCPSGAAAGACNTAACEFSGCCSGALRGDRL